MKGRRSVRLACAPRKAPRATSRTRINQQRPPVTRHGSHPSHTATTPLRRVPPATPSTRITIRAMDISRGRIPILLPPAGRSHLTSSRLRLGQAEFMFEGFDPLMTWRGHSRRYSNPTELPERVPACRQPSRSLFTAVPRRIVEHQA